MFVFHGFSGCPDALNQINAELNHKGFVTVTPLLPGQGIKVGYGCEKPGICVSHGTNPSELPTTKEKYARFVEWAVDMINEEAELIPLSKRADNFYVGVLGFSTGGPSIIYNSL